ncbi:MAG: hypothetical protein ABJB97_07810 [Acidobacteriota bacterium]
MVKQTRQQAANETQPTSSDAARPEVIVEFLFERGLLFIAVNNIGERPALNVAVKFNQKLMGWGGTKDVAALALFKSIAFLGPGREITTFLDRSSSYFTSKQPTKIQADVSYTDLEKREYVQTIKHDLEIYRDLAIVVSTGLVEEEF